MLRRGHLFCMTIISGLGGAALLLVLAQGSLPILGATRVVRVRRWLSVAKSNGQLALMAFACRAYGFVNNDDSAGRQA